MNWTLVLGQIPEPSRAPFIHGQKKSIVREKGGMAQRSKMAQGGSEGLACSRIPDAGRSILTGSGDPTTVPTVAGVFHFVLVREGQGAPSAARRVPNDRRAIFTGGDDAPAVWTEVGEVPPNAMTPGTANRLACIRIPHLSCVCVQIIVSVAGHE